MKLSGCLIIKNESQVLDKCLKSLKGISEIIIVDTGSTDKTIEIAEKYTDKIFIHEWKDDFAKARNHTLDYATGDWICSIDADEQLLTPISEIKKQIENIGEFNALNVKLVWDDAHFHIAPRIFKKGPRWIGSCHEYIVCNPKASDIVIKYDKSPTHDTDPDRNLRMLKKSSKVGEVRAMFYLAHEYQDRLDYKNCIKWVDKYVKLSTWRYEKADAYLMKSRCLFDIQRGDEAREACLMAILLNPNFKEALRFMADISWEKEGKVWRQFAEVASNEDVLFIREPTLYSGSYPSNREPTMVIIKSLNPKTIFELGVGTGYYGELIRKNLPDIHLKGVEIFEKYRNKLWDNYNEVLTCDIFDILYEKTDLFLMVDIIEHLDKEDAYKLLKSLDGTILISAPKNYDQGEVDGNKHQAHISKWSLDDFKDFDYTDYSNELSTIVVIKK